MYAIVGGDMVGFCEEVLIGGGEEKMAEFYERIPAGGGPEYGVGVDIFLFAKVEKVDQGREVLVQLELVWWSVIVHLN